jgi:hypothetical protein
VVFAGETLTEPFASGDTAPIPPLIEKLVAFEVTHSSFAVSPVEIDVGAAVSVQVGAGGGATVTTAVHVDLPPAPVTLIVYVSVFVTEIDSEPDSIGETFPTP